MTRLMAIWRRLSKREKGLVVLCVVVIVALIGRSLVYEPFVARMNRTAEQLQLEPERLARNQRYLGRKQEITANLEKARTDLKALEPLLLTGDTASVSASDIQRAAQDFASRSGTQVVSTRVLNAEPLGTFTRIPIQLEVSGLIDQVAGLVQSIETAPKLLVINEVNIRSFAVVGTAPRRPDGTSTMPPQNLRVSLTVSGYIRSQPAAGKEAAPATSKAPAGGAKSPPGIDTELRPQRRPQD
ncbi:MAG TPA: type II secretion system protein GspM [Candidatus Binatia bacterium]|jgi:Tfp pilus assembly protein PilO|nr:type II secretion system protein GspM [Candidatus Binatia bacterium]